MATRNLISKTSSDRPLKGDTAATSPNLDLGFLIPVSPQAARMMGYAARAFGTTARESLNYERYSGRFHGGRENISVDDLRTTAANFRELDQQASTIRLQDEKNRREFDSLHATLASNRREMEVLQSLAELEVLMLPKFGIEMQFYTYAIFSAYISAALVVASIFDLGGNRHRFKALEAYVDDFMSLGDPYFAQVSDPLSA
jgi:hypothetical protein